MNDLARLGQAMHSAMVTAQRHGHGAEAGVGLTPLFAVAMLHTYRELLLLALDAELETAARKRGE